MENVGAGRRIAIVGAGPSGFYASEQLLSQGFEVDLIDLLPTPFGLVRAGPPTFRAPVRFSVSTQRAA